KTRFEHVWELRQAGGWHEFSVVENELGEWIEARAWTTGDGPKALFDVAVSWLRERKVLLPGVTRLVRLVAARREAAHRRFRSRRPASSTSGSCARPVAGTSFRWWRTSSASGSRPAPGPPETGRRRCSTSRSHGCESARCCCQA